MLGSEGWGLCCFVCEWCDWVVLILMFGCVNSFNVVVVVGVVFFEVCR